MSGNNQIVVFGLDNQQYALPVHRVSEIIRLTEVTEVPNVAHYYKGVINLRGEIIPVMSLSLRLGLEEKEMDSESRIVVIETESNEKVGLVVDNVYSVTQYSEENTEKPKTMNSEYQFIESIIHDEDRIVLLLDLDKITGESKEDIAI